MASDCQKHKTIYFGKSTRKIEKNNNCMHHNFKHSLYHAGMGIERMGIVYEILYIERAGSHDSLFAKQKSMRGEDEGSLLASEKIDMLKKHA